MTKREITLLDGSLSHNYSEPYQRYCEAKTIASWSLIRRQNFLERLQNDKRREELKYWLKLIWDNKAS